MQRRSRRSRLTQRDAYLQDMSHWHAIAHLPCVNTLDEHPDYFPLELIRCIRVLPNILPLFHLVYSYHHLYPDRRSSLREDLELVTEQVAPPSDDSDVTRPGRNASQHGLDDRLSCTSPPFPHPFPSISPVTTLGPLASSRSYTHSLPPFRSLKELAQHNTLSPCGPKSTRRDPQRSSHRRYRRILNSHHHGSTMPAFHRACIRRPHRPAHTPLVCFPKDTEWLTFCVFVRYVLCRQKSSVL